MTVALNDRADGSGATEYTYREVLAEGTIFYNVVMFVPLGLLLPFVFPKMNWKVLIVSGFFCSLTIKILQLIRKCGLFELDDLFHNTAGALIGYELNWVLGHSMRKGKEFIRKK